MIRILRAFVWLRWRTLLNSLERRTSRDTLERFSIAVEQLAPTIAAIVLLPSMISLAGLAGYVGWSLARGEPQGLLFEALRFLLLAACGLAVAGPIMLPGGDRTNAVRLLLLPIPRGVLYLGHAVGALADPWVLLATAAVLGLPLGLAAGGSVALAALAAAAGLLLIAALTGISLAVSGATQLFVRDRRRGELLALAVVVVLPMIGMLPALMGGRRHYSPDQAGQPRVERRTSDIERQVFALVPSELYVRAVGTTPDRGSASSATALAGLLGIGATLHLLAFAAFVQVLGSTATTGPRRVAGGAARRWRIPGIARDTSAIAINQIRLALRTPRGRATLLSPIVVFGMFAIMTLRSRGGATAFAPLALQGGLGLATFSSFVSLLGILPLAMNQFAIDRAGLTMTMLAPVGTMALLRGKAIGNAVIALIPATVCFIAAALLLPGGDLALWVCIPLTAIATYLTAAPIAAILSAIFPRAVDLNSIGRGSNAHGAAGLLGMLAFVAAAAPGTLLAMLAALALQRPLLAPLALVVWIVVSLGISLVLFRLAADIFDRRRENLGLTSQRS
jgi:hypothetical protein